MNVHKALCIKLNESAALLSVRLEESEPSDNSLSALLTEDHLVEKYLECVLFDLIKSYYMRSQLCYKERH